MSADLQLSIAHRGMGDTTPLQHLFITINKQFINAQRQSALATT